MGPLCRRFLATWIPLGLALGSCAAPRRDWQRGEWVVASDLAQPEARLDAAGRVVGVEADLLRAVARKTDRVLVWRRVDAERALQLLETGRADLGVFRAGVLAAWGERADRLPVPYDDLAWRVTPARAGVLEELVEALDQVRPAAAVEPRP